MQATTSNISQTLSDAGYEPQFQDETNQVFLILNQNGLQFPLFFRLYEEGNLLQLLVFMITDMKFGCEAETARLLHLMNKEMDIPGFGMDEEGQVIYFRSMLPVIDGECLPKLIVDHVKMIEVVCETFQPIISSVAKGGSTYQEIVDKLKHMPDEDENDA